MAYGLWTRVCGPILVLLALLTGCTAVTHVHPHPLPTSALPPMSETEAGYHDYIGVIHVHTTYSHDAHGTFEHAVRVANAQRLDYLIITDHNTLRALREGKEGWHGTTLVLIGEEISTRSGHYLALNVHEEVSRRLPTQQIIDEVNRQGGLGFIAHPYFKKRRWTDWSVTGYTGIETYNVAHDTLDENTLRLVLWTLGSPAEPFYLSILDRPYDPLAKWDELIRQRGPLVGIGSSDAHEIWVFGITFAPYEDLFQLVRTHLLIRSATLTPELVYDALRHGHAYVAIELIADARGFSFTVDDAHTVRGIMGDTITFEPGLHLSVSLPAIADLTLFRDGQAVDTRTDYAWQIPLIQPGAYRLEAIRHGKPWIFSNPIYVRPTDVR